MMQINQFSDCIEVNAFLATPKYQQVYNSILTAIYNGLIKPGDSLPSINDLSNEIEIARGTIEKTYNLLKKGDVLLSVPGKGYFIKQIPQKDKLKVCLIFNKLSTYKKTIFDAFEETLGEKAIIDLHIYNNSIQTFEAILRQNLNNYSHIVIIPPSNDKLEEISKIINLIPKHKLVLLDKKLYNFENEFAGAFENFEKDIYQALKQALPRLRKYRKLKLVFPKTGYYPVEITNGFVKFCQKHNYHHSIIDNLKDDCLTEGDVFIVLHDEDLACLLEKIKSLNLIVGENVGIVSYNEAPIKQFISNGITTISTDFKLLGVAVAKLVLENSKKQIEIPFRLTLRDSL